jgi:cell division protein FtsW (lipid II flippase)
LAQTTTPLAGDLTRDIVVPWRSLAEAALLAAVVALVLPGLERLRAVEDGRDNRFRADSLLVQGLPAPVLPALCRDHAALAERAVATRLCDRAGSPSTPDSLDRMPRVLQLAQARATQAFTAPLEAASAQVEVLRAQQRDGEGDVLALDDAIAAIVEKTKPYVARYAIEDGSTRAPLALTCAYERVDAIVAEGTGRVDRRVVRANGVLVLGAALDGHPATDALARAAALSAPRQVRPRCASVDTADALRAVAALMTDARDAALVHAKNEGMRALLRTAGWQWAAWSLLGLVLLNMSRTRVSPVAGCALTLAAWAIAAWTFAVPWPYAAEHPMAPSRLGATGLPRPAPFVLVMLAAAATLLIAAWLAPRRHGPRGRWRLASPAAYPGAVLATGIGWLVLLDLSANGHDGNRYLALYHQGHLWLAMTLLGLAAFLREPIGRGLAWLLAVADGVGARVVARIGAPAAGALLLAVLLVVTTVLAVSLAHMRQLTSELGRLWLIVGGAWFFFLRGTPLTERAARDGSSVGSLLRYIGPLLVVVAVLVAAMLLTRDMGPLLIAGYGAGAFVAASVSMWSYARGAPAWRAHAMAGLLFAAWIAGTTGALYKVGALDDVAAGRLENATAPLASANDHLALVTWFQQATPPQGFGPGAVPWCGFGAGRGCPGVPAQIQSDYTFTALVGEFGWMGAWALTLGAVAWLFTLARRHASATRGEPRLVRVGARLVNDDQAFVGWMCVAWVALTLCQLGVTVAGNLAVIPLTGVTFPFVSFGMTSLCTNMAMLGLALNVRSAPRE